MNQPNLSTAEKCQINEISHRLRAKIHVEYPQDEELVQAFQAYPEYTHLSIYQALFQVKNSDQVLEEDQLVPEILSLLETRGSKKKHRPTWGTFEGSRMDSFSLYSTLYKFMGYTNPTQFEAIQFIPSSLWSSCGEGYFWVGMKKETNPHSDFPVILMVGTDKEAWERSFSTQADAEAEIQALVDLGPGDHWTLQGRQFRKANPS